MDRRIQYGIVGLLISANVGLYLILWRCDATHRGGVEVAVQEVEKEKREIARVHSLAATRMAEIRRIWERERERYNQLSVLSKPSAQFTGYMSELAKHFREAKTASEAIDKALLQVDFELRLAKEAQAYGHVLRADQAARSAGDITHETGRALRVLEMVGEQVKHYSVLINGLVGISEYQ